MQDSTESECPRVVLCECADLVEAETIRIRLSVEGIDVWITGTDAATALSMGGAGTDRLIRVEVPSRDAQFAYDLLQEDRRRTREAGPWICGQCGEQNEAAFELCWKCDKRRDENDPRGRLDEPPELRRTVGQENIESTTKSRPPLGDQFNPYCPVQLPNDHVLVQQAAERITTDDAIRDELMRAFRAAVVGILVFPPIVTLYSVMLLLGTDLSSAFADRKLRVWLVVTVCINTFVIVAVGELIRTMFFS